MLEVLALAVVNALVMVALPDVAVDVKLAVVEIEDLALEVIDALVCVVIDVLIVVKGVVVVLDVVNSGRQVLVIVLVEVEVAIPLDVKVIIALVLVKLLNKLIEYAESNAARYCGTSVVLSKPMKATLLLTPATIIKPLDVISHRRHSDV